VSIQLSSRALSAAILAVLVFSVAPAPVLGSDASKPPAASPKVEADFVLEGAEVYTVDAARTWAEAVAIRGDEIVYVGSNDGATHYVGPRTRVVNLAGKMILPGFQDAHVHPLWAGVEQLNCKLADLVVLDRNLFAIDANEISEAKVLLTLLGGKPVYGNWNDFSD
jgi:hypothetical protein